MKLPHIQKILSGYAIYFVFCFCALVTVIITFFLQNYTKQLLRARLDERLIGIVSTASLQFSGDEIDQLYKMGIDAAKTDIYKKNVLMLQAIRSANQNIYYSYIIGETDDPNTVQYIVDADAITIVPTVDFNEDGVIDDLDISKPGDEYDATEVPAMQGPAFEGPVVDSELSIDSWGTFLSAYAPIYTADGKSVGSLVIDVEVSDFRALVNATFIPFVAFIIVLILLISFLTISIIRIWRSRIDIMKELDRQKDELLGIVSHQLATPISALKWDFEMLLDGDFGEFNAEQKSFFGKLQEVARHLADLASMILDVSRIQLGRMKVDRTDLDLQAFFGEILTVMEAKAQERKVNLVSSIPKSIGTASLDKRLMHMIVENLMSNAIKYTPESGKVKLDVSLVGKELKISVSDTGCGIPKQDQDKIFGKLFRASNVRSVDGNGFGLYVVKGATEAQGGEIHFESIENKGTTFFVNLQLP